MTTARSVRVTFQPIGRRGDAPAGASLLEAARELGIEMVSLCGGAGSCGTCRVRLVSGALGPIDHREEEVFSPEELQAGYRLACLAIPTGDVEVEVLPEALTAQQRLQLESRRVELEVDPAVTAVDLEGVPSDALHLEARAEMGVEGLGAATIPPVVQEDLADLLRTHNGRARVAVRAGSIVAARPPGTPLVGLAVDVGTTKLAGYLRDLATGEELGASGAMNPQIRFGEDLISRIAHVRGDRHAGDLQSCAVEGINRLIEELCDEAGLDTEDLVEVVMVGNTVMHHLLFGLPVGQLGVAPYEPATFEPADASAAALGLQTAPAARIYSPPIIAGYVGGDHLAMLLAGGLDDRSGSCVAIDIGTNTEITLAAAGRRLSCSCASGPAFEGAHITDGMRAAPGAIERVQITADATRIATIGDRAPVGVCGSGALDTVAELRRAEVIDRRGVFRTADPRAPTEPSGGFVLAPAEASGHGRDVVFSRRDVEAIQLAKAAIRAGIEILLAEAAITADEVTSWIVAGAFGTYLDVDSAIGIGMFPRQPRRRFHQIGNAAGLGAQMMLVSAGSRRAAEALRAEIEYVELSTHPGFPDVYVEAMYL